LSDCFEINYIVWIVFQFSGVSVDVVQNRQLIDIKILVFVEEILSSSRFVILSTRDHKWNIISLDIMKNLEHMLEQSRPLLLNGQLFRLGELPFGIANVTCAWPTCEFSVYTTPSLLEDLLHLLQSVKGGHLLSWLCVLRCGTGLRSCRTICG